MNGRQALSNLAPKAGRAVEDLETAIWSAATQIGQLPLATEAVRKIATGHGIPPVPGAADEAFSGTESERIGLHFAEQMSCDVTRIDDQQRQEFLTTFGGDAVTLVQIFYVADMMPRVRFALDKIFGESPAPTPLRPAEEAPGLDQAFNEWIASVPLLESLDPILTEVVRLRGAGFHQCRLCQSIRYLPALEAGAPDPMLENAIHGAPTETDPRTGAALRFVDEILAHPGRLTEATIGGIKKNFDPPALTELVLDIARNATNKVAVAFAADAPRVESGFEVCEVQPDGSTRYGLPDPRQPS